MMSDPGGQYSTSTLVVIPDCSAFHVHGSHQKALGDGDLTLYSSDRESSPLILTVAAAAFPLARTSQFGTLQEDTRTYVFTLNSVPGALITASHIVLRLPLAVTDEDSHLATLQETLEAILIKHGLLKDGIDAYADEIARSSQEGALAASARMKASTAAYLAGRPPTDYPVHIDPSVYGAAESAAGYARSAAGVTGRAAAAVGTHASVAGAWLAQRTRGPGPLAQRPPSPLVPTDLPLSENDEAVGGAPTLSALASTYVTTAYALSSSAGALAAAAGGSLSALIAHEFGADARRVADGVGGSLVGAGRAFGDVGKIMDPAWIGGRGVLGALDVRDPDRAEEVKEEGEEILAKGKEIEQSKLNG